MPTSFTVLIDHIRSVQRIRGAKELDYYRAVIPTLDKVKPAKDGGLESFRAIFDRQYGDVVPDGSRRVFREPDLARRCEAAMAALERWPFSERDTMPRVVWVDEAVSGAFFDRFCEALRVDYGQGDAAARVEQGIREMRDECELLLDLAKRCAQAADAAQGMSLAPHAQGLPPLERNLRSYWQSSALYADAAVACLLLSALYGPDSYLLKVEPFASAKANDGSEIRLIRGGIRLEENVVEPTTGDSAAAHAGQDDAPEHVSTCAFTMLMSRMFEHQSAGQRAKGTKEFEYYRAFFPTIDTPSKASQQKKGGLETFRGLFNRQYGRVAPDGARRIFREPTPARKCEAAMSALKRWPFSEPDATPSVAWVEEVLGSGFLERFSQALYADFGQDSSRVATGIDEMTSEYTNLLWLANYLAKQGARLDERGRAQSLKLQQWCAVGAVMDLALSALYGPAGYAFEVEILDGVNTEGLGALLQLKNRGSSATRLGVGDVRLEDAIAYVYDRANADLRMITVRAPMDESPAASYRYWVPVAPTTLHHISSSFDCVTYIGRQAKGSRARKGKGWEVVSLPERAEEVTRVVMDELGEPKGGHLHIERRGSHWIATDTSARGTLVRREGTFVFIHRDEVELMHGDLVFMGPRPEGFGLAIDGERCRRTFSVKDAPPLETFLDAFDAAFRFELTVKEFGEE